MFEISHYIINYTEISSLWCAYSSYVRILLLTNDREFEGNDEAGKVLSQFSRIRDLSRDEFSRPENSFRFDRNLSWRVTVEETVSFRENCRYL